MRQRITGLLILLVVFLTFSLTGCSSSDDAIPYFPRSAGNVWTWVSGGNDGVEYGIYGTQGVAAAANVPGSRYGAASWKDADGNFWLFGGYGDFDEDDLGTFNDLWKYDHGTGYWTWMAGSDQINQAGNYGTIGVPHADNYPGSRESMAYWTDAEGNFWLFGGYVYEGTTTTTTGYRNDLWKRDAATGVWTWVSGSDQMDQQGGHGTRGSAHPDAIPGARGGSAFWTDADGNFWLFGGHGFDRNGTEGYLNDLWKYDHDTGYWTWMSGSSYVDAPGEYGIKGVANEDNNVPGARYYSVSWTDADGNFWLFGGYGWDSAANEGRLNDLWKYDHDTGYWTWMSGSDDRNEDGVYGTKGVADAANVPGARLPGAAWTDADGNFWLFGGSGLSGNHNDLWKYAPATDMWTWVSGSDEVNQAGVYGTKGVASAANIPGARWLSNTWMDASGNLWLFGGSAYQPSGDYNRVNDLWRYKPE